MSTAPWSCKIAGADPGIDSNDGDGMLQVLDPMVDDHGNETESFPTLSVTATMVFEHETEEQAFTAAMTRASQWLVRTFLLTGLVINGLLLVYGLWHESLDLQPTLASLCGMAFLATVAERPMGRYLALVFFALYIGERVTIGTLFLPTAWAPHAVQLGFPLPYSLLGPIMIQVVGSLLGLRPMRDTLPWLIFAYVVGQAHMLCVLRDTKHSRMNYSAVSTFVVMLTVAAGYLTEYSTRQRWCHHPMMKDESNARAQWVQEQIRCTLQFVSLDQEKDYMRSTAAFIIGESSPYKKAAWLAIAVTILSTLHSLYNFINYRRIEAYAVLIPAGLTGLTYFRHNLNSLKLRRGVLIIFSFAGSMRLLQTCNPDLYPSFSHVWFTIAVGTGLAFVVLAVLVDYNNPAAITVQPTWRNCVSVFPPLIVAGCVIATLTFDNNQALTSSVFMRPATLDEGHPLPFGILAPFLFHYAGHLLGLRATLDALVVLVVTAMCCNLHIYVIMSSSPELQDVRLNYMALMSTAATLAAGSDYSAELDQRQRWILTQVRRLDGAELCLEYSKEPIQAVSFEMEGPLTLEQDSSDPSNV